MTKNSHLLFLLLLFFASFSCDPKEDPVPETDPFPSLSIYVDRFVAEARARGLNLDMSSLDVQYVDDKITQNGREFCGYGWSNFPPTGRRQVLISRDPSCGFAINSDIEREIFVFHEIGHAFLNLQHDNSFLCDNRPLSIMHENVNLYGYYEDSPEYKDYYLNELFDRLAAEEECIKYAKEFDTDPVFFTIRDNEGSWIFSNAQGSFTGQRITNFTPNALVISSVPNRTSTTTGYWFTQIYNPNIPKDARVTLRTKVYSEGLTGPGVAIGLRVYEAPLFNSGAHTVESQVLTTENTPINGTLSGQILELTIPKFTRKTEIIIPFAVMMPGTQGQVRFEDFEIRVQK